MRSLAASISLGRPARLGREATCWASRRWPLVGGTKRLPYRAEIDGDEDRVKKRPAGVEDEFRHDMRWRHTKRPLACVTVAWLAAHAQ